MMIVRNGEIDVVGLMSLYHDGQCIADVLLSEQEATDATEPTKPGTATGKEETTQDGDLDDAKTHLKRLEAHKMLQEALERLRRSRQGDPRQVPVGQGREQRPQ